MEHKIEPGPLPTPCHVATGRCNTHGYPVVTHIRNGKRVDVSVYTTLTRAKYGDLQGTQLVRRHLCGRRACINPEHISVGTKRENWSDLKAHAQRIRVMGEAEDVKALLVLLPLPDAGRLLASASEADLAAVEAYALATGCAPCCGVMDVATLERERVQKLEAVEIPAVMHPDGYWHHPHPDAIPF